ncbi:hypothetical protein [Paenibacillus polymyxa]|uniref:Uncharacterized protein n=1 Tax=Paenibacillus polymyxa (strain SC2) TaxID=886882 RepID=E3EJU5_PAEPS|nr:hypothetical protein [Paenibacillus polymyxa]ADO59693.1 hypothetical protein PPSC2_26665 [Paenibacillus polymyxa SC2]WPQ59484.1 hypothetical protein SKN87_27870 [Paenibacillus polymyxa]
MTKQVVVEENIFNKGFKQAIQLAVQSENVQEGEPFAILQNVAIIGVVENGEILIQKMLKDVV